MGELFTWYYRVFLPLYSVFIIASSILLLKTTSTFLLLVVGALFIGSAYINKDIRTVRWLSLALLATLHWYSQLNWCNMLYLTLLAKEVVTVRSIVRISALTMLYTIVYSSVRLSYMEPTAYNILVTGADFFASFGLVVVIRYLAEAEYVKRRWRQSKLEAEAAARAEKLRVVGELAAGMAHEIRNPLTTVKGFVQVAHRDGNLGRWYELIMDEITRMNELTSEFLQFSKPSLANMKPHPLQGCASRAFKLLEPEGLRQGHTLRCDFQEEAILVRMDRDKIVQMLINLVKNAFDAMEESGVVTIAVRREGTIAVMTVEDTGKGIPAPALEKLFDPFYTTKEHGTGLGLAISHKIVADHGGTMEVRSRVDEGTTFTLRFPIAEGASVPAAIDASSADEADG
ncbi:ATP-binding protein [Paenibacillus sp.]|uniref:two-component system sensor histidine kinase NtrB n=1 Tax=Paenibacillus sp. TaxID=58172 RepID=UPI002811FF62|nr:ATP-binding protein [Paenibacillus sp.]